MKNRLLIAFFGLAIFSFFSFQPPTLHPEIAAAKAWYEANNTNFFVPNWNAAELDIYSNGNVTVTLPVSNFSTYKWMDANHSDTSQVNGTTRIMIGKRPNKPYEAYFLKFDFYPTSLTALGISGLQNIRLNPTLLNSMGFNGICYAQGMIDSTMHGGLLFENGVPTKNVYRSLSQDVNSVTDRSCIYILLGYQTFGTFPDEADPQPSTPGGVFVSNSYNNNTPPGGGGWTWGLLEVVCENAAPWTTWGNPQNGLGQYWQYPWGLSDAWSTYPGGNTWNPPPPPQPQCQTQQSSQYKNIGSISFTNSNIGTCFYTYVASIHGCNAATGGYSSGNVQPVAANICGFSISYSINQNDCLPGTLLEIKPCKWSRTVTYKYRFTFTIHGSFGSPAQITNVVDDEDVTYTIQ